MTERLLIDLSIILGLGILSQWFAWRLHFPAILLLLISGYLAGPALRIINPDQLFGELLLPIVSISVALILFEGGLSLRFKELKETGNIVFNLVSIGVIVSWVLISMAINFLLGINYQIAILLGAILVVTGPTVIIPILRHIKPVGKVGPILKWEGIMIDPIGAILAVIVFEALIAGGIGTATVATLETVFKAIFFGTLLGLAGAGIIVVALRNHWIPDFLQTPITLTLAVGVFTLSNIIQTESGLVSVTIMGMALANQSWISIKHIAEFKETLRLLLISILFVTLAARINVDELRYMTNHKSLIFLAFLILVVRPIAIMISTFMEEIDWRERIFLSFMCPRGIVAAAVSSVFAIRLVELGYHEAELMVPVTFLVITGTVTIYGLIASPLARWLKIATPNPQGLLIIGAHSWAREMAKALFEEGYKVLLVDSNWNNISMARKEGLPTYYGNILSENVVEELDLSGIGKLLAITPNDEVNSLAVLHLRDYFSSSELYQLPPQNKNGNIQQTIPQHLRGRLLFGPDITFSAMQSRFEKGAVIKKTTLTEKFDFNTFKSLYGEKAIPLFLIRQNGNLVIFATDNPPIPQPGQKLISLVNE